MLYGAAVVLYGAGVGTTVVHVSSSSAIWAALGALAAVAAMAVAFLAWYLPQRDALRKKREHERRVWDEILGVEAEPGVTARPGLAQKVDALAETITNIAAQTTEAVAQGKTAVTAAMNATTQGQLTHTKLDDLHKYSHDFRHDALSEIAKLKVADAALEILIRQSTALQALNRETLQSIAAAPSETDTEQGRTANPPKENP